MGSFTRPDERQPRLTIRNAVVGVDMGNDAIDADYIDFLTLIKLDDIWKAVAKVFHQFMG